MEKDEIQKVEEKQLSTQVDNFLAQWNQHKKIAIELLKSNFLPPIYQSPEQVMAVMLKGKELNIPYMSALQQLTPINGRIGMEGRLMVALAQRSGKMEGNIKVEFNEGDTICTVTVQKKGCESYMATYSIKEAQVAGLLGKDNWKKYPKDMLQWRAIARNLKVSFAQELDGIYLAEELQNIIPSEEVEFEEVFNEDFEYKRLHETIQKYSIEPTEDSISAFLEINRETMEKLSEKKRGLIMRFVEAAKSKIKKEVINEPREPVGSILIHEQGSEPEIKVN